MAEAGSVHSARAVLRAAFACLLLSIGLTLFGVVAHAQTPPPATTTTDAKKPDAPAQAAAPADEGAAAEPGDESLEPKTGAAAAPPEGVEEITVIGEALETSTQQEAEAITTFDQAELDTLGISDVDTLALNTPSLHVGQVGQQAVITLRGVGLENLTSIGEAGVGFQVDGVHLARPAAANAAFFDVERVDVLRGPQGTNGGRNLNGGKIAVWSAKPTEEFEAKGDVTYGNYDDIESRAVLNVPIWNDKLMSRVSAIFARRRGYQDNDFYSVSNKDTGDAKDYSGRLQLRSLLFDDSVELRGIATHGEQKGRGPDLKLIGAAPSTLQSTIDLYTNLWQQPGFLPHNKPFTESKFFPNDCPPQQHQFVPQDVCTPHDPRDTFLDFVSDRNNHQNGLTGLGTYDLPLFQDTPFSDLRLGLVSSWQQTSEDWVYDFDGTNVPAQILDLTRNAHQYSMEAYIERPDVGRWDFRTGVYWLDETIATHVCFDINGPQAAPGLSDFWYKGQIYTKSIAGYGQAGFRLTENLRASGGIRWTRDEKSNDEQFWNINAVFPTDPLANPNGCGNQTMALVGEVPRLSNSPPTKKTQEYEGLTPMAQLDWQVTDTSTLSLSVTRGFKSGGFPTVVSPDVTSLDNSYDSEFTWTYQLTSKNELFDGRLRLNTTGFWTEYDPFQVCQFNGPAYLCDSNGSATIRGIEIEYVATPMEGLQLNGFFNWLDSRINNMQVIDPTIRGCTLPSGNCNVEVPPTSLIRASQLPVDVSGNRLTRSPEWAGSFGIQYEFDFGRWGYFTPRFATQFQGLTYYRVFNSYHGMQKQPGLFYQEDDHQNPFIKYDAKIMWRSDDDRFTAEIFGVNLSDEDVLNSVIVGSAFSGGQALGQYQAPRTYGIKFGINYISDWLPDIF
jgi:iron complex outermembrane receptor protein